MAILKFQIISPLKCTADEISDIFVCLFVSSFSLPISWVLLLLEDRAFFCAQFAYFQDLARDLVGVFKQILKVLPCGSLHSGILSLILYIHLASNSILPFLKTVSLDFCLNSSHKVLDGLECVLRQINMKFSQCNILLSSSVHHVFSFPSAFIQLIFGSLFYNCYLSDDQSNTSYSTITKRGILPFTRIIILILLIQEISNEIFLALVSFFFFLTLFLVQWHCGCSLVALKVTG